MQLCQIAGYYTKNLAAVVLSFSLIACGDNSNEYDDEYYDDDYHEEEVELGDWEQYRGVFQTAAVSVATGRHFKSDNGSIEYVKSLDKKIRRADVKLFVWRWPSNDEMHTYIVGYADDYSFDVVFKENEQLSLDSAIKAIVVDDYDALGEEGKSVFWQVTSDIDIPYIDYLPDRKERSTAVVADVVDLSRYTDTGECQLFFLDGTRQGFQTPEWVNRIRSFRSQIDKNEIASFTAALESLDVSYCQQAHYDYIYNYLFAHERNNGYLNTRSQFLETMLRVAGMESLITSRYGDSLCEIMYSSIFSPPHHESVATDENYSVEFVDVVLEYINSTDAACNLWEIAAYIAKYNRADIIDKVISIESSRTNYKSDEGYTALEAFNDSARHGHYDQSMMLLGAVQSPFHLEDVLIPIASGGRQELLDEVLKRNVQFQSDDTDHSCTYALIAAFKSGSVSIVDSLFSLGCELPERDYLKVDLFESIMEIRPGKEYSRLYEMLAKYGLHLEQLSADQANDLVSKLIRKQVVSDSASASIAESDQVRMFHQFTEKFIQDAVSRMGSVDYRKYDETLLMQAIEKRSVHSVATLLSYEPDLSITNNEKKTALALANDNAQDLHKTRHVFGMSANKSIEIMNKRRKDSLSILKMLGGETSVFDVYIY